VHFSGQQATMQKLQGLRDLVDISRGIMVSLRHSNKEELLNTVLGRILRPASCLVFLFLDLNNAVSVDFDKSNPAEISIESNPKLLFFVFHVDSNFNSFSLLVSSLAAIILFK
jgi:hypothetical protein